MNPILIIANFKSNKTKIEAEQWLREISEIKNQDLTNKRIIVCPSFTLLDYFKSYIGENNLPIELGAQDISRFAQGAHTGEVNGIQIKEFVNYVIIGHSERRTEFNEGENILKEKIKITIDCGLNPVLCVQNGDMMINQGVSIVAYEPVFAIGSGNPDTPENANEIAKKLKINANVNVLYGGSVTSENVSSFTGKDNIDGVLVGGASLEASELLKIVENAK